MPGVCMARRSGMVTNASSVRSPTFVLMTLFARSTYFCAEIGATRKILQDENSLFMPVTFPAGPSVAGGKPFTTGTCDIAGLAVLGANVDGITLSHVVSVDILKNHVAKIEASVLAVEAFWLTWGSVSQDVLAQGHGRAFLGAFDRGHDDFVIVL